MFPGVWLHFNKFSGKYFLVFGKEEGKHKSRKTQATTQKKIINNEQPKPSKMHQIRQKKPKPSKRKWINDERCDRHSSIDERCNRTARSRRSRRSSIDERCDRPNDRTARSHRSRSSIVPLVGTVRSSDERRDRQSEIFDLGSLFSHSLSDLGSLFSLSLSLSFSGNELKWKWGWKIISGSKVKISVNRKLFSGKWNLPSLPNAWVWGKMISWNHFHPKQTHPKWKGGQLLLRAQEQKRHDSLRSPSSLEHG